MTNEQIVAELGWTRKAIQSVIGVTPTTMRPPFGDIGELGKTGHQIAEEELTAYNGIQMTAYGQSLLLWEWCLSSGRAPPRLDHLIQMVSGP